MMFPSFAREYRGVVPLFRVPNQESDFVTIHASASIVVMGNSFLVRVAATDGFTKAERSFASRSPQIALELMVAHGIAVDLAHELRGEVGDDTLAHELRGVFEKEFFGAAREFLSGLEPDKPADSQALVSDMVPLIEPVRGTIEMVIMRRISGHQLILSAIRADGTPLRVSHPLRGNVRAEAIEYLAREAVVYRLASHLANSDPRLSRDCRAKVAESLTAICTRLAYPCGPSSPSTPAAQPSVTVVNSGQEICIPA